MPGASHGVLKAATPDAAAVVVVAAALRFVYPTNPLARRAGQTDAAAASEVVGAAARQMGGDPSCPGVGIGIVGAVEHPVPSVADEEEHQAQTERGCACEDEYAEPRADAVGEEEAERGEGDARLGAHRARPRPPLAGRPSTPAATSRSGSRRTRRRRPAHRSGA